MMKRQPFTLLIHIALAVILAGAIVTHFCGIQGEVTLPDGGEPVTCFTKTSGPGDGTFPFAVALDSAEVVYYPGTATPMDFRSHLSVDGRRVDVSMNRVGEICGWRFYQSGISASDSTLSVSHDPWGTGLTYAGYALLLIGMSAYFFQRNTPWRALWRARKGLAVMCVVCGGLSAQASDDLPAMQRPLAADLGRVYVYWNDRVCPMQTMARDVTARLYGGESYRGLTPEQVLSGWLFYFDRWERDWRETHEERPSSAKRRKVYEEREALIQWLGTGEAFKIYPYRTADGHMEWLSLTGRRPSRMGLEQWRFMQTTMHRVKEFLLQGKNIEADSVISELIEGQKRYAGSELLPSDAKMRAERVYNVSARPALAAVVCLLLGLLSLWYAIRPGELPAWKRRGLVVGTWATFLYVAVVMTVMWWIGGHLPLSNGPETMMFMGLVALAGACVSRSRMMCGAALLVGAMALFVAAMGGRVPRVGALMPVLASPLLSVHVMLVMTSYVLFLLMSVLSVVGLMAKSGGVKEDMCRVNRLILTPAVFLLAGGIFVGAVWANQSWGRYWGWDPKETCALVMLLVYSVPLHWGSRRLACFRKPKVLHVYLLVAVLTVLFTYFGANYLLPGLHSYA